MEGVTKYNIEYSCPNVGVNMSCKIIKKIKGFANYLWQLIFGDDRDIIEKRVCELEKKVQDLEQRCNQEHAKIAPHRDRAVSRRENSG